MNRSRLFKKNVTFFSPTFLRLSMSLGHSGLYFWVFATSIFMLLHLPSWPSVCQRNIDSTLLDRSNTLAREGRASRATELAVALLRSLVEDRDAFGRFQSALAGFAGRKKDLDFYADPTVSLFSRRRNEISTENLVYTEISAKEICSLVGCCWICLWGN